MDTGSLRWVCLVVAVSPCAACSLDLNARDAFVGAYYCPRDQVGVDLRRDIPAHTLTDDDFLGPPALRAPGPGELDDPAVRARWERLTRERAEAIDSHYRVYLVRGCGRRAVVACEGAGSEHHCVGPFEVRAGHGLLGRGDRGSSWPSPSP